MARRRRGAPPGVQPDSRFELWWLFWAAVTIAMVALLGIAVTTRPGPGEGVGSELAWGVLASAMVLLWAVVFRLVFWCIGRIAVAPLRRGLHVAVPALVLLAREGALGERPARWCGFELRTGSSDGTSSATSHSFGTVPMGLPRLVPGCRMTPPAPGSDVARGFAAELAPSCTPGPAGALQLRYTLEASDAWCYLPLVKWASWPYRVHIELTGFVSASSVIEGRIEQRSYGLESCRGFDERLGHAAAAAARAEGDRLMAELRERTSLGKRRR
jgi:hypothetical protein